jgi:gliding motility-associated-like protein
VLDTFPTPLASLGPDSFVCEGSSYRLTPGTFSSYTWQDNSQSNVFNATAAGKYYVSVKDQNNCEASDTVVLTTKSKPAISMVKLLRMCNPDTLITPKGIFKTYLWQDGSTDTSYRVRDYGIFTFTATDSNNCSNVALLEVKNDCPPVIFVPNAFTPNDGDGLNDFFFPVIRNVKEIEFKVYNRWGELLFETTKLNDAWDGTFRNKPATADVYVYTIKFVATNGDNGIRNGNVTLLR